MARSINTIYQEMLANKALKPELNGLTSNSIYAIWKNMYYILAIAISVHEQYLDLFKVDLEYIKSTASPQTALWWNDKMVNQFQYDPGSTSGSATLSIGENLVPYYFVVDPSKRIVKYASTKQTPNTRQSNIKIAKDDGNGNPAKLSNDELLAAASYIADLGGAYINVISNDPDSIKLDVNIYFNAQFGQASVLANVTDAIKSYLSNLFNTSFDGTIYLSQIVDSIQQVPGVKDVLVNSFFAKQIGGGYGEYKRVYNTQAGYAILDIPNTTINMITE